MVGLPCGALTHDPSRPCGTDRGSLGTFCFVPGGQEGAEFHTCAGTVPTRMAHRDEPGPAGAQGDTGSEEGVTLEQFGGKI